MNATSRPRYALIDALRGLAACAVMLYHFTRGDLGPGLTKLFGPWFMVGCDYGWLGVQVFFVLSGFVIANSIGDRELSFGDAARFALRRQVRLDPPYWVSLAIAVLLPWWFLRIGFQGTPIPAPRVIGAHLLYAQDFLRLPPIQPVYWTLAIEVQFYLVFVVALALLRPLATSLVPWVLAASALYAFDAGMHWRFLHGPFVPHWYLFALGASSYWVLKGRFSLVAHVALALWFAWKGWQFRRVEPLSGVATALLITAAGKLGGLETWLRARWLQFLGRMSYGIYLLHPIAGGQARWHVGIKVDVTSGPGSFAVIVAGCGLTIGLAWILHRFVEEPSMRLAGRIRWWRGEPRDAASS
jgi:peptidoglycan/LPS O-acetylase OafA/YrhL